MKSSAQKIGKTYSGYMRSRAASFASLPLLAAAAALACPASAQAQGFSADYGLSRPGVQLSEPPTPAGRLGLFNLGPVRINPAIQSGPGYSGAGLSLQAGRHWFAQVGVGHELQQTPLLPVSPASSQVLSIAGGYRFGSGQAMSLQLSRGAADRLGLSVRYDWPRYFVRLSYDTMLSPPLSPSLLPQDRLRFSAGVRF